MRISFRKSIGWSALFPMVLWLLNTDICEATTDGPDSVELVDDVEDVEDNMGDDPACECAGVGRQGVVAGLGMLCEERALLKRLRCIALNVVELPVLILDTAPIAASIFG